MLIRCKQSRRRATPSGAPRFGSTIDLTPKGSKEKRLYRFKPLDSTKPDENHVCDVTDQQDIAKLLAIPEGYEIHASELERRATPKAAPAARALEPWPEQQAAPGADADKDKRTHKELLAAVAKKTDRKPSPATSRKKLLELLAA